MLWYVTAALACCGGCLVGSIGLLALTSFYVYDSKKNIPSDTTDKWNVHVTSLVPITIVFAISSVVAAWIILGRNRKRQYAGLLIWNLLALGACVYFSVAFHLQHKRPDVNGEDLFSRTRNVIWKEQWRVGSQGKFIPVWLDNIQNKSKECCGIRHFRDYEELWPAHDSEVPKSCCKEPSNPAHCLTDLLSIPFPGVPSMYIKTDTGCIQEINAHIRKNIRDCFVFVLILTGLYALAQLAYIVQYVEDYVKEGEALPTTSSSSRASGSRDGKGDEALKVAAAKRRGFLGLFRRSGSQDLEQGSLKGQPPGGDIYDNSGVGSFTDSGYTASQGTLGQEVPQGSSELAPFYKNKEQEAAAQLQAEQVASSDELGEYDQHLQEEGRKKKRKHKKHKRPQNDATDAQGLDSQDQINLVPDNTASSAQPILDPSSPLADGSPRGSDGALEGAEEEVGDKVSPACRPGMAACFSNNKDKFMGFVHNLGHKSDKSKDINGKDINKKP